MYNKTKDLQVFRTLPYTEKRYRIIRKALVRKINVLFLCVSSGFNFLPLRIISLVHTMPFN
jgi:hypothetical protein